MIIRGRPGRECRLDMVIARVTIKVGTMLFLPICSPQMLVEKVHARECFLRTLLLLTEFLPINNDYGSKSLLHLPNSIVAVRPALGYWVTPLV